MDDGAIELVCFDLGGVLIRIASGWEDAFERSGVPASALRDIDPETVARSHESVLHAFETGQIAEEEYFRQASGLFGVEPAQMKAFFTAWLVGPYPGVDDLLDALVAHDVRTACLSNTSPPHWRMMHDDSSHARMPLEKLTDRFASHLAGAMKPDAAIYELVEQVTGVPGEAILFFDDYGKNVEAAKARGWQAHKIDSQGDTCGQVMGILRERGVLPD